MQALAVRKDQMDATPAPAAPAAMPTFMARKAKAESAVSAQSVGTTSGAIQETPSLDARTLFYGNQVVPGANAFVPLSGGGGGAAPPTPRTAKAVAGLAANIAAAALRLGVRISILRGDNEADLNTALDPGEAVRLKLIPNSDGFLYVADGAQMVASGAVQRLKPFVTPELRFEGSGQKQLYVMLARTPQTVAPQSIGTLAHGDLVETSSGQEPATYVVTGTREAAALRVVVPVTLTWR